MSANNQTPTQEEFNKINNLVEDINQDKQPQEPNQPLPTPQSNINYAQYPMPKLLEYLGYEIKRAKSTQRHIVMSDGNDTLIISRGKGYEKNGKTVGEGNYLYFNTHNTSDKGTIYSFCKNRNIDINTLASGANIKDFSHELIPSDSKYYDPEIFKKYTELESYNKSAAKSLSQIRKINPNIVEKFDSIKVDGFRNVIFPSYTLEESIINAPKKEDEKDKFALSGAIARSFTKSDMSEDKEQRKEDWEYLKTHPTETKELLKNYIKETEEELKYEKHYDLKELSALKKDLEGYKQVIEKLNELDTKEKTPSNQIISILTLSGMNKKLIEKPLTHDRNGNLYDKPLNSLEEGKAGLSILIPNGVKAQDITKIITGENSIDNLSYVELKKIDLSNTALISFNGSMKDEAIKAFQYLVTKELPNIKEVVAAFDNDKQGIEYDEKLKNILLKSNPTIEMIKDKSTLKDWNEDLKSYKKSLHNSFNHARNYEKSFTLEMEK
jgi:hypothetical protein